MVPLFYQQVWTRLKGELSLLYTLTKNEREEREEREIEEGKEREKRGT